MPGKARLLHMAQRADRLRQRNARIGPVDQQEVDVGEAQLRQAFLGGPLEFARRQVVLPDLGGDEDVVAPDPAGAQTFPDLALIAVHLGGVDVAVSEPQRLLDHPRAQPPAQIPGAETDRRNPRAVRLDIRHRHGVAPRLDWHPPVGLAEPPPCEAGLGLDRARFVCDPATPDRTLGQALCPFRGRAFCCACHPAACPRCTSIAGVDERLFRRLKFPENREFNREFLRIRGISAFRAPIHAVISMGCRPIP
jgi:hypothetical protein